MYGKEISIAGTQPRRKTRRMCNLLDALETVKKIYYIVFLLILSTLHLTHFKG